MVIVSWGAPSTAAVQATNKAIPVVFNIGLDPVKAGFVHSLSRPGANLTGIYQLMGALAAKRLSILRDLLPGIDMLGVLLNPDNPTFDTQVEEIRKAADSVGQRVTILHATKEQDLDIAGFAQAIPEAADKTRKRHGRPAMQEPDYRH